MRLLRLHLGFLVLLGACTVAPPATPAAEAFSGSWLDPAAALSACGETLPVRLGLELSETETAMVGSFRVGNLEFAFDGVLVVGALHGTVRTSDGSTLTTVLGRQDEKLVGAFTATADLTCAAGERSRPVYKAEFVRP